MKLSYLTLTSSFARIRSSADLPTNVATNELNKVKVVEPVSSITWRCNLYLFIWWNLVGNLLKIFIIDRTNNFF